MSLQSWIETVGIGQSLSLLGPNGLSGHNTSLDVAHANGLIIFKKSGREIGVEEYLSNPTGVDIVRAGYG